MLKLTLSISTPVCGVMKRVFTKPVSTTAQKSKQNQIT